jgi:hypothetical protein
MSPYHLGVQSGGQSSKRSTREYSVNSTPSKKSASVDDCLNDLTDIIKDHKLQQACINKMDEEMEKVKKMLKEDGFQEYDDLFTQAIILYTNTVYRRTYLGMDTKEGRFKFLHIAWADRLRTSK